MVPAAFCRVSGCSHRVFLDTEQREMDGRTDRVDAAVGFDTNDQDANDLERSITVPCHSNFRSAHVGDVSDHAGARILFFGVDSPDGGLSIARKQSNKTFHLRLGIASEAYADLIICGPRRR